MHPLGAELKPRLSPEVVRRNMPSEDGRPRILSPRVAKVLEAAKQQRKADGAA